MVEIVNGYVCFNCTDTEKAQKGIDPAHPAGDPLKDRKHTRKPGDPEGVDGRGATARISASGHLVRVGPNGAVTEVVDPRRIGAVSQRPPGALLPQGVGVSVDVTA